MYFNEKNNLKVKKVKEMVGRSQNRQKKRRKNRKKWYNTKKKLKKKLQTFGTPPGV
jgi:hypothetical protein